MRAFLAVLALLAALPIGAQAAAIAAVDINFFSLVASHGIGANGEARPLAPSEVTFFITSQTLTPVEIAVGNASATAGGDASTDGNSVFASVAATAQASQPGYAFASADLELQISISIAADSDLLAIALLTEFSAFNPGGNPVGAAVDNIGTEFARFASLQFGEGIGDIHGCDTRVLDDSHFPAIPPAARCGVSTPDASQVEFVLGVPDERIIDLTYRLFVEVEAGATAVTEPGTLALLSAGLLVAALARRRT